MNPKEINIVLLGNSGVGKTSIIDRFCNGNFTQNISNTVGSDHKKKIIDIDGQGVQLNIWDTAGQEKYRSIAPMIIKKAHACILVADIQSRGSFRDIEEWREIINNNKSDIILIFAINKIDLNPNLPKAVKGASDSNDQLVVERDDLLDEIRYLFKTYTNNIWVSALSGEGVDSLFQMAAELVLDNQSLSEKPESVNINDSRNENKCC